MLKKHKPVASHEKRKKLADYVRSVIKEKELSLRKVAQNSGGGISAATVSEIVNLKHGELKTTTMEALAKGLGVSSNVIFDITRGEFPEETTGFQESDFARIWEKYERLPLRFKNETDVLIRSLEKWVDDHLKDSAGAKRADAEISAKAKR